MQPFRGNSCNILPGCHPLATEPQLPRYTQRSRQLLHLLYSIGNHRLIPRFRLHRATASNAAVPATARKAIRLGHPSPSPLHAASLPRFRRLPPFSGVVTTPSPTPTYTHGISTTSTRYRVASDTTQQVALPPPLPTTFSPASLSHPRTAPFLCPSPSVCCCNAASAGGPARRAEPNTISPTNRAYLETTGPPDQPRDPKQSLRETTSSTTQFLQPLLRPSFIHSPFHSRLLSQLTYVYIYMYKVYIYVYICTYVHRNSYICTNLLLLLLLLSPFSLPLSSFLSFSFARAISSSLRSTRCRLVSTSIDLFLAPCKSFSNPWSIVPSSLFGLPFGSTAVVFVLAPPPPPLRLNRSSKSFVPSMQEVVKRSGSRRRLLYHVEEK